MPSLLIENVKAVPKMNVKLKTGVASDFTQLLWDFSDLDQNYIRVTKNDHESLEFSFFVALTDSILLFVVLKLVFV